MLTILRENDFVREYEIDGRHITDSKYRTCELPFRANYFIARWNDADAALRCDMVTALGEFPHTFSTEAEQIREFLRSVNLNELLRAAALMEKQRELPSPDRLNLFVEIYKDVLHRGAAAWTCVGECRWFRVMQSITEIRIDEKEVMQHVPPSEEELVALADSLPEGMFKWGVEIVAREYSDN